MASKCSQLITSAHRCVGGCVVMQKPAPGVPRVGILSWHLSSDTLGPLRWAVESQCDLPEWVPCEKFPCCQHKQFTCSWSLTQPGWLFWMWRWWASPLGRLLLWVWIITINTAVISCYDLRKKAPHPVLQVLAQSKSVLFLVIIEQMGHIIPFKCLCSTHGIMMKDFFFKNFLSLRCCFLKIKWNLMEIVCSWWSAISLAYNDHRTLIIKHT
jgi:hypothetical protein